MITKQTFDELIKDQCFSITITYVIVGGKEITETVNILSTDKDTLYYGIYENDQYYEEAVRYENIINILY